MIRLEEGWKTNPRLKSTDILKRGIDIPKVDLVINYDFPTNEVDFQHRAARAGRFGRKGITISFIE